MAAHIEGAQGTLAAHRLRNTGLGSEPGNRNQTASYILLWARWDFNQRPSDCCQQLLTIQLSLHHNDITNQSTEQRNLLLIITFWFGVNTEKSGVNTIILKNGYF